MFAFPSSYSSSSVPTSPTPAPKGAKRAAHLTPTEGVSHRDKKSKQDQDVPSDPRSDEPSSFGSSFELADRVTANDWLQAAFDAADGPVICAWQLVKSLWTSKDSGASAIALPAACHILKHLHRFAVGQNSQSGSSVPPRVWSTLFCRATSPQKWIKYSTRDGGECWSRAPCRSWEGTLGARERVDVEGDPFRGVRALFDASGSSSILRKRNAVLYKSLVDGMSSTYTGTARETLIGRLLELDDQVLAQDLQTQEGIYGRVLPIVQSSGAGKSRLLQEMCALSTADVRVYAFVLRLGDAGSFPAPDEWFLSFISGGDTQSLSTALLRLVVALATELQELPEAERSQFLIDCAKPESSQRTLLFETAAATTTNPTESVWASMRKVVSLLGRDERRLMFVLGVDQAETLSSGQLAEFRRLWSPHIGGRNQWVWGMPSECFLVLSGTDNQLGSLAPLPAASGSDRLKTGKMFLPRPFTSLDVQRLEDPQPTNETEMLALWHNTGRHLWRDLPRSQSAKYIASYLPSLGDELSAGEVITLLSQRIAFDLLTYGKTSGSYEMLKRVRDLEADQINTKFAWLLSATCRSSALTVVTISEPIVSYYLAKAVSEVKGWKMVLEGFTRLVHSMRVVTLSSGAIGEVLTQILCSLAMDQLRWRQVPPDGSPRIIVNLVDFLVLLVARSRHPELRDSVESGGYLSVVRFRQIAKKLDSITPRELHHLWARGEGIQGAPSQGFWDQLIPIRWETGGYSYILIQSKNQVGGPSPEERYQSSEAYLPITPGQEVQVEPQRIFLYMEVGGNRPSAPSSSTSVLRIEGRRPETRNAPAVVPMLFVANHGRVTTDAATAAAVFPVLEQDETARPFCDIVTSTFVEREETQLEKAARERACPQGII